MIAAFDDYLRIARVTTTQRDPRSGKAMTWLASLLVLALAIGTLVAAWRRELDLVLLARAAAALGAFWLGIVWSLLFVPGSVLVNSAINARLLPRQRRRLMQMAVAGWLLCTVAMAFALDSWAALPITGLYLIGLPLMIAGYTWMIVFVMLTCAWPALSRTVLPHALVEAASSTPGLLALSVLLLPVGAYALRKLYPAGGDAHMRRRAEQVRRVQRFANNEGSLNDFRGAAGSGMLRLYGAMLRRDGRRGDPSALLLHALGPLTHWSAWLTSAGAILLVGLVLRAIHLWNGAEGRAASATAMTVTLAAPLSALMVMLVLFTTAAFGQQLRRTHGEQALLRLTPLAGDAALLNRRLSSGLLRATLRIWLVQVAAILAATALIGIDGGALLRQFALCCLAGQIALMGLLGDYAREAGWNPMLGLRAAVVAAVEGAVAAALGAYVGPSAWPWLIVISACAAVVQVRLDRERMLAAPAAFPAGRLA